MCRWRRGSEFGEGRRVALDREQRAVWRARLRMSAFRGPGKLTANAVLIGERLLGMLGKAGELFPSIETLRQLTGIKSSSTVVLALKRLRQLGFLTWARRLARFGSRVVQVSNAYVLTPGRCDAVTQRGVVPSVLLRKEGSGAAGLIAQATHEMDLTARENAARQLELL